MRIVALVLAGVAACATTGAARRELVTDEVGFGEPRGEVIAWHDAHGWCRGRIETNADEFEACGEAAPDDHGQGGAAPPTRALFEYRAGVATAMAVFVPVPCELRAACDDAETSDPVDAPDVPDGARIERLATQGLHGGRAAALTPSQRRALDALGAELVARYGPPTWTDPARAAMTWSTPHGEHVALFLDAHGTWLIETHLFGP